MLQTKIGVMTPTFNRPDLARFVALQMNNQSVPPALLCIHQNGTKESYQWAIDDVAARFELAWLHSPTPLPQYQWYIVPLLHLLEQGCTHFFWCDHDDIYARDHIETGMGLLAAGYDHVVNAKSNMLLLHAKEYEYKEGIHFSAHAPGGMSSSMCFNRAFAEQLMIDLQQNHDDNTNRHADQIVAGETMPKFRCQLNSADPTTTYVCHTRALTSNAWIRG
jgi:hypothetical protein